MFWKNRSSELERKVNNLGENELKKIILKKIEAESENYYLEVIMNSKAIIYARAEEIYRRCELTIILKEKILNLDEIVLQKMMYSDHILDELYRFDLEKKEKGFEINVEDFLETLS